MLNWRILPALKFSPKELLLGLVVNTASTPLETSTSVLTPSDVDNHLTYAAQQRLDGYAEAIHHAIRRKATFDRKVLKSSAVMNSSLAGASKQKQTNVRGALSKPRTERNW